LQTFEHLVIQPSDAWLIVPVQLGIHAKQHDVLRIEPDIDLPQIVERAQEQSGADEQYRGNGDLNNKKRLAKDRSPADHGPAVLFQSRTDASAPRP
jgi:hypothetical protein